MLLRCIGSCQLPVVSGCSSPAASMSCMSKSTMPAPRVVEFVNLDQSHLRHGQDQHLGDAHAALDDETLRPKVDKRHLHFTSVVAVDGAGGVYHRDAELAGQPRARSDLRFVSMRHGHRKTAWDEPDFARLHGHWLVDGSIQIEPRRVLGHFQREGQTACAGEALDLYSYRTRQGKASREDVSVQGA